MTNWSDPAEIAKELQAAKLMVMICLGYAVCDLSYTWRFDLDLITGRRGSRKWPQLLYVLAKLGFWPYIAVTFAVAEPPAFLQCNALVYASEALMGVMTCCCSGLLAFRAVAVWNGRAFKVVASVVTILFLALVGIWMAGVPDVKAVWIEGPGPVWIKNQGTCTFLPIPKIYGVKFIATVVFDAIVLLLTVAGVMAMTTRSRIGTILVEQGIFYFGATLVMNVFLVSFTYAELNPLMSNILNVPTQTVSLIVATRLYMMLCDKVKPVVSSQGQGSSGSGGGAYGSSLGYKSNGSSSTAGAKIKNVFRLNKDDGHALPEAFGMRSNSESNSVHLTVDVHSASQEKFSLSTGKDDDLELGRAHPYAHSQMMAHGSHRSSPAQVQVSEQMTVATGPVPAYLDGLEDLRKK
ncbi:uncharacterized protein PFL1_00402 [Pseudozyma flocculosa PF-1]|uniref:Uncharacterized protein n=1 Tax=Pseudozyma flocculosa TaxID=84751 RepID=A0A5C3EUV5_9BASI|nr:uncharacterized protein PFL1_00402 [Pseudozyma flocculosa PF-1]EPQ32205.1 hypothetical protein PFL1_00402 [Pseudozyma flocculosa PF-1]SPO34851.1 uncharacterized protein PSFLO_00322 [Pseudozyma flocculosa]